MKMYATDRHCSDWFYFRSHAVFYITYNLMQLYFRISAKENAYETYNLNKILIHSYKK